MAKQKKYSAKFKTRLVLEALKEEKTVPQIAAEYNINPNNLFMWKNDFLSNASYVFEKDKELKDNKRKEKKVAKECRKMEQKIGQLTLEVDYLRRFCAYAGCYPDEEELRARRQEFED